MGIVRGLLLVGLLGLGWHLWKNHSEGGSLAAAVGLEAVAEESQAGAPDVAVGGFVDMPALSGGDRGVIVFAPPNCPSAAARRADSLVAELRRRGVPVRRSSQANFDFDRRPDAATMRRIESIMEGEIPVVFVGPRAASNPAAAAVLTEYRRGRKG